MNCHRVAILVLAVAAWAPNAQAEDAAALFERGVKDMLAKKFETGCPAIAESYRLEPLPGVTFTLAECEAQWGRTAEALKHYEQFIAEVSRLPPEERGKHDERRELAIPQIKALRVRVPSLTLSLPEGAPAQTSVTLNGNKVSAADLGKSMPLDPGTYTIRVTSPGRPAWEHQEVLADGDKRNIPLQLGAVDAPVQASQRTIAYVVGGVGVAALIVGAITGAVALSKASTVEEHCLGFACDAEGKRAADAGQPIADASTVMLIVGGIGVGAGAALWLTAPDGGSASAASGATFKLHAQW